MKQLTIAISGINATDNPGPGVAVAKSLKEALPNVRLIGLSYDVHDPGNYMKDLFENCFLMPYPTKGWQPFALALKEVIEKYPLDFMIPCLDAELPLLIKHHAELEKLAVRALLPRENQFELRSKDKLIGLSKKLKCEYPKTIIVNSMDELVNSLKFDIGFPAVVKGKLYKAYVVYNLDTAILKATEIAAEWGFPLLVQEKISGQEINLIGLGDGKGGVLGQVAIKKQLITQLGKVWTAVTIFDQDLHDLCTRFCEETKWQGPFELECMRTESGISMIEINPRFPAWVYFATGVGVNLPEKLVQLLQTGICEKSLIYPVGKYLVRYSTEFVTELSYFQNLLMKRNREGQ